MPMKFNHKKNSIRFYKWSWSHFRFVAVLSFIVFLLLNSCKKKDLEEDKIDYNKQQVIRNLDSIYLYAKQIYLWNTQLPSIEQFNPQKIYQPGLEGLALYKREVFELSRFALNPKTNISYEYNVLYPLLPKFSAILEDITSEYEKNKLQALYLTESNPFGLSFYQDDVETKILYTDLNSPAGKSGLKRGDRITAINDRFVANPNEFLSEWKIAIKNSFIKLSILDNLGKVRQVRLTNSFYEINPLLKHSVIDLNTKKIGYIAYNSFTDEINSRKYLEPVLQDFNYQGISELIIDLRYNTGGFQNTVVYLANQICAQSLNGKVMFTEHYNQMMQDGKADILSNQLLRGNDNKPIYINGKPATLNDIDYSVKANTVLFDKHDGLTNIKRIYFIISEQTASASELLISILKPYIDVKLIGVSLEKQSSVRTYGKPVGFFDINIDKYKMFMAMYQTKNAMGDGDYFEGFLADNCVSDDPKYDFGSSEDPAMKLVLNKNQSKVSLMNGQKAQHSMSKYIFNQDRITGSVKVNTDLNFKKK